MVMAQMHYSYVLILQRDRDHRKMIVTPFKFEGLA